MKDAEARELIVALENEDRESQNRRVVAEFWPKFQTFAAKLPFAEDVAAMWYCATDRDMPWSVRGTLLAALAYFIMPLDAVPDIFAFIGMTDDVAVLGIALSTLRSYLKDEHYEQAREKLAEITDADESS